VVVRALGAVREYFRPAAHQQNLLTVSVTDQLASVGELGKRDALSHVGPEHCGLVLGHSILPLAI
jgi:hypothetical protein